MNHKEVAKIIDYWRKLFGENPRCELNYNTPAQLMVAIILSAQCTDKRVNMVTEKLFEKYKIFADFAGADVAVLEKEIYSAGFYHNKAQNIVAMARTMCERYNGLPPKTVEELSQLSGVGRKTASVFLCEYYGLPAMPVDTHIARIAKRLGLTASNNPAVIERDLKKIFPEAMWAVVHLYMIHFGRYYCKAQKPACENCGIRQWCVYIDA